MESIRTASASAPITKNLNKEKGFPQKLLNILQHVHVTNYQYIKKIKIKITGWNPKS